MNILSQGIELDIEADEHLEEYLNDGEQNLEQEASSMLGLWNKDDFAKEVERDIEKRKQEAIKEDECYYDGETDFDDIIEGMEPIDDSKQVYVKILKSCPEGKQINASHTILFDRIGYVEHQLEPFESSIYDGEPTRLSLLEGPIIPGLLEALTTMREGESATVIIRPSMAYGNLGIIGLVPEDATLFYHLRVHKVWDESKLNELINLERSEMAIIPIEQKLAFLEEHKEIANQYLRDGQPREAVIRYKAGIKCIDSAIAEVPQLRNDERVKELLIILLQNASISFNKLKMHKAASNAAKRALFENPRNVKAYYQLAKARIALCDYSSATMWIEKANKLFPDTSVFDHLKLELDFQYREESRKRDELMRKMSRACQ